MRASRVVARIGLPPDFSFDSVVRSHGWYDLPPFSYERNARLLTTVIAERKRPVRLTFRPRGDRLEVTASAPLPPPIARRIARRVFSLDLNLAEAARGMEGDAALTRALRQGRGRMLRAPTLFEDAVKILFTTNCTWAATRGMVGRLIQVAGPGGESFPDAAAAARLTPRTLVSQVRCGYRAVALSRFARRVDSGRLDLSRWESGGLSSEELRREIVAEHGFGPYAAEGLLRILGRHDFYALDSWVRQQYRKVYPGPAAKTDVSIGRRYARYGPHRGLALWLEMTRHWHEGETEAWP
ncbi:MAG: DNA-3-methyladenine glycosylase [Thermoanaerobaculia bacterium]